MPYIDAEVNRYSLNPSGLSPTVPYDAADPALVAGEAGMMQGRGA